MRNLAGSFTMRRDGVLPRGEWFRIENKEDDEEPQVYIYDEIGFWGTEASDFVKELQGLDGSSFTLHLNSPGGEVFDGIAIHSAIKQHKGFVTVKVDGLAASAASFIAQAGDKVIMARNAQMMIHDGIAVAYGNEADLRETADLLGKVSNNIADMYSVAANKRGLETTLEDFRALMREEVWYTGKEAVEAGLADEVLDHDNEEGESTKNKWDLSFYNHAGREKAESPSRVAARLLVSNHAKENEMAVPKAKNQSEETPAPEAPAEENEETQENETPEAPEAPEAPAPEAPAPPTPAPENRAQGVMINGKLETDWAVINAHFETLRTANEENVKAFRSEFVENLSKSNKIAATQIDSLTELALDMTDKQFAAFQASYESAPASALFDSHGVDAKARTAPKSDDSSTATGGQSRREHLEGVVDVLARSMTPEKLEKTNAYIELQALQSGNNES